MGKEKPDKTISGYCVKKRKLLFIRQQKYLKKGLRPPANNPQTSICLVFATQVVFIFEVFGGRLMFTDAVLPGDLDRAHERNGKLYLTSSFKRKRHDRRWKHHSIG